MFAKVHPPEDVKAGNTGSCRALAEYLDKEAGKELKFFSHAEEDVPIEDVVNSIDHNKKALGAGDAKFFMLSLNPSEAEQKHLIGRDVNDISELTPEEHQRVIEKLRIFTRSAMDEYALNFGRDKIRSGADLMYFARIETQRLYKPADQAVREGFAKIGQVKPGLQFHVHIIVSRKSLDGKTKLSPQVKSMGNEWELEGRGTVKRGFSHENWKVRVQEAFNKNFNYQSKESDTYHIKQIPELQKTLTAVPNQVQELLKEYQFTAANQIIFALREQGYTHTVRRGVHTFSREGESFQVSHIDLKKFERPLSDEQLRQIAERFDLAKYENAQGVYNENGLQVKEISFDTYKTDENGQKTLKNVVYKVIVDEKTKTVASFSTVRQFAFANHINLIKSDRDKAVIVQRMKNADLKNLLTNYRFTADNQIIAAMKEQGYKHTFQKGRHTFEHPSKGKISILHKDLVRFPEKVDDETMRQIAERFNLYKFKQEHSRQGYAENGLVSKTIQFSAYVQASGEQQRTLKEVRYDVIYDEQTRTTVPVSQIRYFAYQHGIPLMDRNKHAHAVQNEDLRECLQDPAFINIRQINKEMRARGYQVSKDEDGNYTYTRAENSFSIEGKDMRSFTNYAKDTKEKDSQSNDAERVAGIVGGKVQQKVLNEILGDNFQTERMIAGHVRTAINVVQNPANIKMMLIKRIGQFLNPFKEL